MKRVGFDPRCGALTIMGGESYFPGALMAEADGDGMIRLQSCAGRVELYVPWPEIANLAGETFASENDALAYLAVECAKQPARAPGPRGPGIFSGTGDPDAAFGLTGDLYLDALTGDIFIKES